MCRAVGEVLVLGTSLEPTFSTLTPMTLGPITAVGRPVPCGCGAATLASTHWMPEHHSPTVTTKMSPDIAKCPQGGKIIPVENQCCELCS